MSIDPSRALREYALQPLRSEMRAAGMRVLVIAEARGAGELARTASRFDGAWIELESVAGLDVQRLGGDVVRVLKPGGRLVCVVPGALPLRRLVRRALLGRVDAPDGGSVREGPQRSASFSAWRRAFAPLVAWRRARSFGVLVPPASEWARLHPLAIALLAAVEHVVGGWPLVRALGEHVVHEGVRR